MDSVTYSLSEKIVIDDKLDDQNKFYLLTKQYLEFPYYCFVIKAKVGGKEENKDLYAFRLKDVPVCNHHKPGSENVTEEDELNNVIEVVDTISEDSKLVDDSGSSGSSNKNTERGKAPLPPPQRYLTFPPEDFYNYILSLEKMHCNKNDTSIDIEELKTYFDSFGLIIKSKKSQFLEFNSDTKNSGGCFKKNSEIKGGKNKQTFKKYSKEKQRNRLHSNRTSRKYE